MDAIAYRHEVFRELEHEDLSECVNRFVEGMRAMRDQLARVDKLHYALQRQRWFLDAVGTYCGAVARFAQDLERVDVRSRGWRGLRRYVDTYARSPDFTSLRAETAQRREDLAQVSYSIDIKGDRVTVRRYDAQADYSREVEETFQKFRQGAVNDYRVKMRTGLDMDHVEAAVLDRVALLHPDVFEALADFCEVHGGYLDETIRRFDREVQFYVSYLEHVRRFEPAGLAFCYPIVSGESKEVHAYDTFDLALAETLRADGSPVVCNDFSLEDPERIFVVSGPNQGGKTTFARTFGQLHHLASLGCPVPGREAQLFLFDALFTHFEKEEDIGDLSGKLETDLQRTHAILERATPRSVMVMNESFSSTTLHDALFLGTKVLEEIMELGALCVYVTFVDELASLGDATVSMVSTIAADDPAVRTYKIERRPADGLAYAAVLAERHGLAYETLKDRIAS